MNPGILALCWLLGASLVWGGEDDNHQRVGMEVGRDHRWDGSLGLSLVPWDSGAWTCSLVPTLGYEHRRAWSLALSLPYLWEGSPRAAGSRGAWGDLSLSLAVRTPDSEPRWRLEGGVQGPLETTQSFRPWRVSGGLGMSLVRDPVILGLSLQAQVPLLTSAAPPQVPSWSGGAGFSFQEVVNDAFVWSLTLSPRWAFLGAAVVWSAALTWGIGWFEGPHRASVDTSAATAQPWALSASGGVGW